MNTIDNASNNEKRCISGLNLIMMIERYLFSNDGKFRIIIL
jgi:hypothetical protein